MALFAFVLVTANNNVTNKKEEKETIKETTRTGPIIDTVTLYVNADEITAPYTINLPVPAGTVRAVSGPCNANLSNWSVDNGVLTINYIRRADIECMQDPWTYYIEYVTVEGHKYCATIISR